MCPRYGRHSAFSFLQRWDEAESVAAGKVVAVSARAGPAAGKAILPTAAAPAALAGIGAQYAVPKAAALADVTNSSDAEDVRFPSRPCPTLHVYIHTYIHTYIHVYVLQTRRSRSIPHKRSAPTQPSDGIPRLDLQVDRIGSIPSHPIRAAPC